MLNQAIFGLASAKEDLADFKAKRVFIYDTKGHPKAKGIRLTIPYPRSWFTEEGQHPNIVQKIKTTVGIYLIFYIKIDKIQKCIDLITVSPKSHSN
jgi:hypothetical protein